MDYKEMIDNFLDAHILGQAAGYLYAMVEGKMLPLYIAKERFSKLVDAYSDIREESSNNENCIAMFENLFSENETYKETAFNFFNLK